MNDSPGTHVIADAPRTPGPSGIRASDADREQVGSVLADALGDGRLDHEEYLARLDSAYEAKTVGELAGLTADLGRAGPAGAAAPADLARSAGTENIISVLGSAERTGRWLVEPRTNVSTLMGSVVLDMREAVFAQPTSTVQCAVLLGSLEVVVPPGVTVRDRTASVLGCSDASRSDTGGTGGRASVVLTGVTVLGSVSVRTADPSDSPD
ncbi:DUF1707 SHOCT-like domain-containing protein [Nocardiopsis composta]|uniref:DUF1707 domain-containing protein n=1 Tax=Nocardiopsis composta TaxID=157465 RepID=A0A7W8QNL9_9ACTN|nr:DUF1707 domain-containing protein [Nocardiopsis composta]MBB5433762.1 hypothetical protein [Nocardiopsis composta]